MNLLFKTMDSTVFMVLGYFAFSQYMQYIETSNSQHDQLLLFSKISAAIYIMARRRDINTVTLGAVVVSVSTISVLLVFDATNSSGFYTYALYAILNWLAVYLIWFRPLLFSRLKPFKGKDGFHVTKQDNLMWMLYTANGIFMVLMLIEHASRRINTWWFENSRLLYNHYETIQIVFIILGLVILYFMTFNESKEKQPSR